MTTELTRAQIEAMLARLQNEVKEGRSELKRINAELRACETMLDIMDEKETPR